MNELSGIKESDTGLAPPALWDLAADKQALQSKHSHPLLKSMLIDTWLLLLITSYKYRTTK